MSDIDVFTIDDDFDPLAEIEIEAPDEQEQYEAEYLAPIPDADKSVVPEKVPVPASERIEKLLKGLPGQQFRVLAVVQAVANAPLSESKIVEVVDARYPKGSSVFDASQLIHLLEDAGAIERQEQTGDDGGDTSSLTEEDREIGLTPANFVIGEDGEEYLVVTDAADVSYSATQEGIDAVRRHIDAGSLATIIDSEPRYAPIYARIMDMVSASGGAATKALDAAVDNDPLCEKPRRFCGYFIDKLETAGLIEWTGVWMITDLGRDAVSTGVIDDYRTLDD